VIAAKGANDIVGHASGILAGVALQRVPNRYPIPVTRIDVDDAIDVLARDQAEDAVSAAVKAEPSAHDLVDGTFVGGVCPHDDHLYAGAVYTHITERISAPRVLLIGVFHAARLWNLQNAVVFDAFDAWHGPWGPVKVDPLRADLMAGLKADSYLVDNTMHCREHSLEAIVPFLQATNRDVSIVPLLVPYMNWERIDQLTSEMAAALAKIMEARDWRLGHDLAIVISSDAVHYGPDFNHAPFGTDGSAHTQAVARDQRLVRDHLEGQLDPGRLSCLLDELVDEDDFRSYLIPWCGRFSVPFGLELMRKLALTIEGAVPHGDLLRYGTSVSEPELAVDAATRAAGLGYTAPSNFHHWVGYASIGYTIPHDNN